MTDSGGVVLITGALGGMGSASARALAADGTRMLLTDRDPVRLEEAAAEISKTGVRCTTFVSELTDPNSIARLVDAVRDHGGLKTLVHTAALSPSMADWKSVLTVDYLGTVRLIEGLLPLASRGTSAICFASIAAHQGHPISAQTVDALDDPNHPDLLDRLVAAADGEITSGAAYIWSKTAIVRQCERWAVPWGARGARIVSISPGLMDTPMGRYELEHNPRKRPLMELTPLVRARAENQSALPGRCEDIAAAVTFLASDAASFITGCDLRVDGGLIGALKLRAALD